MMEVTYLQVISSTYVLMSYNEPTNQYTFALAKTEQQENDCKKILEGSA